MIEKVFHCPGTDERGDPKVYLLRPGRMIKTASPIHPEIRSFAESLPRGDGGELHVLLNAMGAAEYYGQNINHDRFDEHNNWADVDDPRVKLAHRCLAHDGPLWGYKTFEHYAHVFQHHRNKDPENEGFGRVKLAVWNDPMKRVELIVAIDREKAAQVGAQDVVDQLDRGEHPDWSMGTRVPWDRCTCHGNTKEAHVRLRRALQDHPHLDPGKAIKLAHKREPIPGVALTRAEYCNPMKTAAGTVRPDGIQVGVHNDFPRMFDISKVYIGADRIAKTTAKLAHAAGMVCLDDRCFPSALVYEAYEKTASACCEPCGTEGGSCSTEKTANGDMIAWLRDNPVSEHLKRKPDCGCHKCQRYRARNKTAATKEADKEKKIPLDQKEVVGRMSRVRTALRKLEEREVDLPRPLLDRMGASLPRAINTTTMLGIVLKPHEFQRIALINLGKPALADDLEAAGNVFRQRGFRAMSLDPFDRDPLLLRDLLHYMPHRSAYTPCLSRRIIRLMPRQPLLCKRAEVEHPLLDKLGAAYNGYREGLLGVVPQAARCATNEAVVAQALFQHGLEDVFAGMSKEAISRQVLDKMLIAGVLPLTYLLAAHVRKKKEKGERVGLIQNFVDRHPVLTSMLLIGAGHGVASVR